MLRKSYADVRRSIVAFASKVAVSKQAPAFPTIIGTGFVVDSRGLVVTNRHVVRALEKLPNHPTTGASAAFALAFSEVKEEPHGVAMDVVFVEIARWDKLTSFSGKKDLDYFGEPLPDLAFVQLKCSGLPAMQLVTEKHSWEIGTSVGTAGFPLGKDAMVIYGKLNQVGPILRQGVIASTYPFPCPRPHGFTIDVMTLGGESGSPIFRAEDGKVLGLLHAGFDHTNITMAIPSWLVAQAFEQYANGVHFDFSNVPTFDQLCAGQGATALTWDSMQP
ncbi:MAG: S1 family peptidase [Thermoanaerobaculia bacterium]